MKNTMREPEYTFLQFLKVHINLGYKKRYQKWMTKLSRVGQ